MAFDDGALARRAVRNAGEMAAALGRGTYGAAAEVRRSDALGARIAAASDNPWFDAAFVPFDTLPPLDDPELPGCLWTVAAAASGRVEEPTIATPAYGLALGDLVVAAPVDVRVERAPLSALADVNERAYDDVGTFGPLARALRDDRIRTYGVRDGDAFVCVALTLAVDDDLGVHFVATDAARRRRGLAGGLLHALLTAARGAGMRTATLLASADGAALYERLGFRRVALLRGFLRPPTPVRVTIA